MCLYDYLAHISGGSLPLNEKSTELYNDKKTSYSCSTIPLLAILKLHGATSLYIFQMFVLTLKKRFVCAIIKQ
jgi:hypothetical protein